MTQLKQEEQGKESKKIDNAFAGISEVSKWRIVSEAFIIAAALITVFEFLIRLG